MTNALSRFLDNQCAPEPEIESTDSKTEVDEIKISVDSNGVPFVDVSDKATAKLLAEHAREFLKIKTF